MSSWSPSRAPDAMRILIFYTLVCLTFQENCFKLKILTAESSETKFVKNRVKLNSNNTVDSITEVLREIPEPIWRFKLIQTGDRYSKVHFDNALKACDLLSFIKRVRFFREMASSFFKPDKGNMTLNCPMTIGTYVMKNLFIPPESKFMRFLFVPNTMLTLRGGISEEKSNHKMEKLCSYEFNGTVLRMC